MRCAWPVHLKVDKPRLPSYRIASRFTNIELLRQTCRCSGRKGKLQGAVVAAASGAAADHPADRAIVRGQRSYPNNVNLHNNISANNYEGNCIRSNSDCFSAPWRGRGPCRSGRTAAVSPSATVPKCRSSVGHGRGRPAVGRPRPSGAVSERRATPQPSRIAPWPAWVRCTDTVYWGLRLAIAVVTNLLAYCKRADHVSRGRSITPSPPQHATDHVSGDQYTL